MKYFDQWEYAFIAISLLFVVIKIYTAWRCKTSKNKGTDAADSLLPERFPKKYETDAQRRVRLKKEKRYAALIVFAVLPFMLFLQLEYCEQITWFTVIINCFIVFAASAPLFPLVYFFLWVNNNYLNNYATKIAFSEIDPIAKILINKEPE